MSPTVVVDLSVLMEYVDSPKEVGFVDCSEAANSDSEAESYEYW